MQGVVAWWRERLGRLRPHAIDAGLAVVVAVAVAIDVSVYSGPETGPPDAFAYTLGVTFGALLLARRRWPGGVLVASVVTFQVYNFVGYPGLSAALPLAVSLYTASAAGYLRLSLGVATVHLSGLVLYAVVWYPGRRDLC